MFKTAHHLKHRKGLIGAANPQGILETTPAFAEAFGAKFQFVTGNEFRDAFVQGAPRVVEPRPEEILNGLRFYLALKNTLPGYPCIAFSKLNDAGLYGVCEGDLASTMTQMLATSYAGAPGFVSDPVFDASRKEVIHAHRVSATRLLGFDAPASPYIIRDHLETKEGAVLQALMPSDRTVTVARFAGPKQMLVSTAEVTGVVDSDRGCRRPIRTRVADAERWLRNYGPGLHQVVFDGDHVRTMERMGRLFGFETVHEI